MSFPSYEWIHQSLVALWEAKVHAESNWVNVHEPGKLSQRITVIKVTLRMQPRTRAETSHPWVWLASFAGLILSNFCAQICLQR